MMQQRLGEQNGRAKLTDAEVELMRTLREEEVAIPGKRRQWSYGRLAKRFGVTKRWVVKICTYQSRTNIPDEW